MIEALLVLYVIGRQSSARSCDKSCVDLSSAGFACASRVFARVAIHSGMFVSYFFTLFGDR